MRQHTTERDSRADESVQFFVSSDRKLEMARGDTLDFEIFGCVAGEFEDFGSEVFEDCCYVDGGWETC